ncbi:1-phosphofructokinase family hexose kinase [Flavobacteriaceae bacterium TP-CH-4]|uniref:1-phosphofructokinase family hexose kinase n=1 Tax=Pelagihabitans pacificus TaxID=2696054 RepID=A0A967ASU3_9FLAO|nr:1-phosphofructokinase family hexose kinase [Pelagihabitans pacificus]NHF59618.1 1-phosphofructokinase family hexose kinase [Pelagihabitans pacificus]
MNNIITLTVNPVVDKNTTVPRLIPHSKLRCTAPIYFPGGGGINVSRAIRNLGGASTAIYLAGGATGIRLRELMNESDIVQQTVPLKGETRQNLSVMDQSTQLQYRFSPPGPWVHEKEWKKALLLVEKSLSQGDYLVASGKLPPGIPPDFFVKVATIVKNKNAKLVLDTKGEALRHAIKATIFLFKPNISELASLLGKSSIVFSELEVLVQSFMKTHPCEIMVVSLGSQGALLATKTQIEYIPAPIVPQKSLIGAGDSMVAGMVLSLMEGKTLREMAQFGVACGSAATMRTGTQLCEKEQVQPLFDWIRSNVKVLK